MCIVSHQCAVHYWTKPVIANLVTTVTRRESPRSSENHEKVRRVLRVERGTHNAVGRRGATDEALDLTLLSMRSLVCLGAGDGGRSCRYKQQTHHYLQHQTIIDQHRQQQNLKAWSAIILCCGLKHKNTP